LVDLIDRIFERLHDPQIVLPLLSDELVGFSQ
jgi:hypothetical protein